MNPTIFSDWARNLDFMALKAAADINGHVPTISVYGMIQCLPINPHDLPDLNNPLKVIKDAREEAVRTVTQLGIEIAISSKLTHATASDSRVGDGVLFSREKTCV